MVNEHHPKWDRWRRTHAIADPAEDVALIISAGMFHKEPSPELVREIAQEVVDYFKEEFDGA